jgi:hypothetical protein
MMYKRLIYQTGAVMAIVNDNIVVTIHNTGNVTTTNKLPKNPLHT